MKFKSKTIIVAAVAVIVSLILFWGFEKFSILDSWQERVYDRFFTESPPNKNIVIVGIDDESIKKIGQWPWKREVFGTLIESLSGAQKIGFDILFSEKSRYGATDDLIFAESIKKSGSEIVLASRFDDRGGKLLSPIDEFKDISKTGYINVRLSYDGVARGLSRNLSEERHFVEVLGGLDAGENRRIFFTGPSKTYPVIPLIDVIEGRVPKGVFEGKIVLVGATAPDLQDILQTPLGEMSGVEVEANALSTVLDGVFLKDLPEYWLFAMAFLISFFSAFFIVSISRFAILLAILIIEFVAISLLSIFAFSFEYLIPNLALSVPFIFTSTFLISYQYVSERKEKQFIRNTFQYYLMPEVIEDLMANPEKLRLGGEKRKVTILFSDIRGFTTLSEKLTPEGLTQILNEYLTEMTDSIMERRGLVDKYIGDAVMAFWGAPVLNENQAIDAADSVLDMMRRLKILNKSLTERNLPNISIGVGINTGEVVVGNMGSKSRFNYSVLGDDVNFASRLEGLNKPYGVKCIVSESTKKEIEKEKKFVLRELDYVKVKGKNEPKKIFELITEPLDENFKSAISNFEKGRELYLKGNFKEAVFSFESALKFKEDAPSKLLLERSKELLKNSPDNWDGVYEFHTK